VGVGVGVGVDVGAGVIVYHQLSLLPWKLE